MTKAIKEGIDVLLSPIKKTKPKIPDVKLPKVKLPNLKKLLRK